VAAAFLMSGHSGSALFSGGLVVAFVLFVYVGRRRSETIELLSGIGDERTIFAPAWAGAAIVPPRRS
jgi:hypothetical protein